VEQMGLWMEQANAETACVARTQASALLSEIEADPDTTISTDLFMAQWRPYELTRLLQKVVASLDLLLLDNRPVP
jgi:hypothetical protein